jgi:hypothetical protein
MSFKAAMKSIKNSPNKAVIKSGNHWKVVSLKAALARGL